MPAFPEITAAFQTSYIALHYCTHKLEWRKVLPEKNEHFGIAWKGRGSVLY